MLKSMKGNNSKCRTIHIFGSILLLSILIPVLIFTNSKSLTFYLTAEKLQKAIESSRNDTLQLLMKFENKTAFFYTSIKLEKQLHTLSPNKASVTRQISSVNQIKEPTARPLTCDGCMGLNFNFIVNNDDICISKNQSIELLLIITSAPQNYLARKTIRNTWLTYAKQNKGEYRYVFLIGNSKEDEAIKKENAITHDIILGNFTDTYSNLTYKTLMGFQWMLEFCDKAKFVMKTDDDMYVNIPALFRTTYNNQEALQTSVGGYCHKVAGPIRNKGSKWYASKKSYPQKTYPGFCSGTGYVTSKIVVSKIVNISGNIPFFHLEDVYVALCIKALGLKLLPLKGFFDRPKLKPCLYKDGVSVVTAHQVPLKWMRHIWDTPCLQPKKRITNSLLTTNNTVL